jgi:DAACS family dicarboxylate/amino acid:cation (Na+ or H+) symporter
MPLHTKILLGLIAGAISGVAVNFFVGNGDESTGRFVSLVTEPIGRMWLNALIMVVVPLIISTLAVGVAGLGSLRRLGRIGVVTMMSFMSLTLISTVLGLAAVNLVKPGDGLEPELTERLIETYQGQTEGAMGLAEGALSMDLLIRIIPRNPIQAAADGEMLAIIFFALMLGVALTMLPAEKGAPMLRFLESLGHVTVAIIGLVMVVAPLGVFCLIFSVTARFGFEILFNLMKYVGTVVGTLGLFVIVVYPLILKFVARRNPLEFLLKARVAVLTAFSTSSSSATLPTSLRVAQENLGISRGVAGFVLPLGATLNMDGTALFEGITVLFLAQVFGADLSLGAQAVVVLMSVITSIGVAGIPGGSIPILMMVLSMVGVPVEGIAIVLGVDRILDMCRTTVNVTGDLVCTAVVERFQGDTANVDVDVSSGLVKS